MNRQLFVYSFAAQGTVVLAELKELERGTGLSELAVQWLPRLPVSNKNSDKFTSSRDGHCFSFLIADGYAYCVVGKQSASSRAEFEHRYRGSRLDSDPSKSRLTKEFGTVMKENMKYIVKRAEEIDKVSEVEAQISQVKTIALDNIHKLVDRGETMSALEGKAVDLRDQVEPVLSTTSVLPPSLSVPQAEEYKGRATEIWGTMWYQNMKINLRVIVSLLVVVLIVWLSICGGFNCSN